MNRKAIAILGGIFLLIVGTLVVLIISRSGTSKNTATNTGTQTALTPDGQQPGQNGTASTTTGGVDPVASTTVPGPLYRLTDEPVTSPTLFFNGTGVTYFNDGGQLYQADFDESSGKLELTRKRSLGLEPKPGIKKVIWPRRGNSFIAELAGSSHPTYSTFDEASGQYFDLPPQVYSIDFMPAGDQVFYTWSETTGRDTVNLADPTTRNYKTVSDIWEKNSIVSVSPDGLNILFYPDGNLGPENKIGLTSQDGKVWKTLVSGGYNYGVLWSPDGKRFLFGKKDTRVQTYQLWVYDLLSGETKSLGLYTTPEKAVWSQDGTTVYVAAPKSGAVGIGSTDDSFYEVNIATLERKEHLTGSGSLPVDAREMFLSRDGLKLFFKANQDGSLYYLDLTK